MISVRSPLKRVTVCVYSVERVCIQSVCRCEGLPLQEAYYETLKTTGKAVTFTGFTLAIGVATWIFSAIKFQADMGILLTFMFLWNMFGALWLLPALARFLIRPEKLRS